MSHAHEPSDCPGRRDDADALRSTIEALIADGALFVANHSGGKDSQAQLIALLRQVPREQVIVVHAALDDVEWPGALEHAAEQAQAAGIPFVVARAPKTFFEMVEHRARTRPDAPCWPSASIRQCTSDLKRGPIEREVRRYAKAHGFTVIVNCVGLRAEESPGRARQEVFRRNARGSVAGRTWYDWLPIHALSERDVFAMIAEAGQRPHPAYASGNRRLSCVFCIMGSTHDLRNGARQHPELYERYVRLERHTGYTMHQSRRSLEEIVGNVSSSDVPASPSAGEVPVLISAPPRSEVVVACAVSGSAHSAT
ncbi:MAG: phosphoadenosine phosphosulfate reductase family protein [Gemmatimonadaceae bacterium]|nr:phosphoadenosine phosphosulfate reductase family protein [Gemmatimonadaceae bacterium]